MAKKQAHLQDLFRTGKELKFAVTIDGEESEVSIWVRKPSASQADTAINKARGRQARRRMEYKDHEGDMYLALQDQMEAIESADDLKEHLVQFENQRIRSQAYNDVLYDPKYMPKDENGELVFGEDNSEYLDLLNAIQDRMEEIIKWNDSLSDEDQHLEKRFEDDEELVKLEKQRDVFEDAVDARAEDLKETFLAQYADTRTGELRKILMKRLIESETQISWYEEYRKWMLYYACRMPDDHSKHYFDSPDDIMQLPTAVLSRLEAALNDLEQRGDDLKNSLSPLDS